MHETGTEQHARAVDTAVACLVSVSWYLQCTVMASTSSFTEKPKFLSIWEELFTFADTGTVAKCLVCSKEMQYVKKFNLQRHYSCQAHGDVRWLSRCAVLGKFFDIREEISLFMEAKNKPIPQLKDKKWICSLAFLADLTHHLNDLNLSLQGKSLLITDLSYRVKAFKLKLSLRERQLQNKDTSHFPRLAMCLDFATSNFEDFTQILSALNEEFIFRFQDLNKHDSEFMILSTPYSLDVDAGVPTLQLELIDLQCDEELKDKFKNKNSMCDFYKSLPRPRFPRLHQLAARMLCMFGTTCVCEQFFSLMKINKSRYRIQMSDKSLQSTLRLSVTRSLYPSILRNL